MASLKDENGTITRMHTLPEKIGDFWLFAVADWLGGHQAGEQTSAIALKILRDEVR